MTIRILNSSAQWRFVAMSKLAESVGRGWGMAGVSQANDALVHHKPKLSPWPIHWHREYTRIESSSSRASLTAAASLKPHQVVQPFSIFPPSPDSTCVVFSHAHSEQIRLLIPPLAICHRFSRRLRAALIAQAVAWNCCSLLSYLLLGPDWAVTQA